VPFGIIDSILGNRAEKKAAAKQHKYDLSVWDYQFDEANRDFDFQVQGNQITRQNIENNSIYQEQSAVRQYQNELAIRDFDYGNQVRQFNESERIYGLQLGFNSQASQVAYEAENRRFQEILTGMAFEQQDMLVKMLQEEGQVQASGASGRSAGKALASAMASYGRNQAIMAESLVSAKKENKVSMRQIDTEKSGADLAAQSRRMLVPLKAPAPMAPLKMPRATIQDPRKPVKPPKPIKGATGSLGAGIARGAASDIGMALSIASMFSDVRLKENVVHVGTAPSGISIYEWNYKWSKQRYRGAIAQDVLNFKPEAVVIMEPGFLGVKYGLIDVSMEPIA
jgi:hypothetical protein